MVYAYSLFLYLVFGSNFIEEINTISHFTDNDGAVLSEEILIQAIYQYNNCSHFCIHINKKIEENLKKKINITSKVKIFLYITNLFRQILIHEFSFQDLELYIRQLNKEYLIEIYRI